MVVQGERARGGGEDARRGRGRGRGREDVGCRRCVVGMIVVLFVLFLFVFVFAVVECGTDVM